jgi:hypothetical protein
MNLGISTALIATPRPSSFRSVRRTIARLTNRAAGLVAEFRPTVAGSQQDLANTAPAVEPDTSESEFFTAETMPPAEDIAEAARLYWRACDDARTADRAKRKAKGLLSKLRAGTYGGWEISREPSGRMVADLEQIRATYKRLGLGPVPMRQAADSLKVRKVELDLNAEAIEVELSTLAGAR